MKKLITVFVVLGVFLSSASVIADGGYSGECSPGKPPGPGCWVSDSDSLLP